MFEIRWIEGDVLNVRMSGFFSLSEMAALEAETARLLVQRPAETFYGLAELALLPVQRPEIIVRLRDLLTKLRKGGMANGAVVFKSVLVKLQTRRAVDPDRVGYFDNREDALSWLAERRATHV